MAALVRRVGPVVVALGVVSAIAFLSASPMTTAPPPEPTAMTTFTPTPSDGPGLPPVLADRRLVVTDGSAAWLVDLHGDVQRTVPSVPSLGGIGHLTLEPGFADRIVHSRGPCELGGVGLQLQRTLELLGCVVNAVHSPEGDRLAILVDVDRGAEHTVFVADWAVGPEAPDSVLTELHAPAIPYDELLLEGWEWRAGSPDGSRAGRLLIRADTDVAWELFALDLLDAPDATLTVPDGRGLVPALPHVDGLVPVAAEGGFVVATELSFSGDDGRGEITRVALSSSHMVVELPIPAPDAGRLWLSAADGLAVVGDGAGTAWYLTDLAADAPFARIPGRIVDAVVVPGAVG